MNPCHLERVTWVLIHLGKNSEIFGLESNGTVFPGTSISKISVNLWRFSIFPNYWKFWKCSGPFDIPCGDTVDSNFMSKARWLNLLYRINKVSDASFHMVCSISWNTCKRMHDEGNNAPPLGKWEERINAEKKCPSTWEFRKFKPEFLPLWITPLKSSDYLLNLLQAQSLVQLLGCTGHQMVYHLLVGILNVLSLFELFVQSYLV